MDCQRMQLRKSWKENRRGIHEVSVDGGKHRNIRSVIHEKVLKLFINDLTL